LIGSDEDVGEADEDIGEAAGTGPAVADWQSQSDPAAIIPHNPIARKKEIIRILMQR
jgi:hypothetical protein